MQSSTSFLHLLCYPDIKATPCSLSLMQLIAVVSHRTVKRLLAASTPAVRNRHNDATTHLTRPSVVLQTRI